MRIAHITDIHVERRPELGQLGNKRLAGALNLYVLGRHNHFTAAAQGALVEAVMAAKPDLVLCTGDLTATATEAEFVAAAALMEPIRTRFDWLAIPGNHDVYTGESVGRFAQHFGALAPVRVERRGTWDVVLVDVCHPDWLSRGWLGSGGVSALETVLSTGEAPVLLALHYPLRGRDGARHGPATRACIDAEAIEAACVKNPRVKMVVHGHEHHGYRVEIPREGGGAPIASIDPGAGGYAFLPEKKRTAHFCVYTLGEAELEGVERFAFDGERFVSEAGGAFASGG
ncbi:metallophosphoesterase [Deltaproteobacteria bacterium]|nr:metallophosphoesterase [Deltaproteobacteria bacterium]